MLFNSLSYILFLVVVFTIYWVLKEQYRWILLLAASYFFYMYSAPKYGLLIFSITLVSYLSAIAIENHSDEKKKISGNELCHRCV